MSEPVSLPGTQNQRAGLIPQGVCPQVQESTTSLITGPAVGGVCTVTSRIIKTQKILSMTWDNFVALNDDGIPANPCSLPPAMVVDPGFALFVNDPWYGGAPPPYNYAVTPPLSVTQGVTPPARRRRRWLDGDEVGGPFLGDPDFVVIEDPAHNKSRRATDEDLLEEFGLLRCEERGCAKEKRELGMVVDDRGNVVLPTNTATSTAEAASPAVTAPTRERVGSNHLLSVATSTKPTG